MRTCVEKKLKYRFLLSSLFIETESFLEMLTLQNSEYAREKKTIGFIIYQKKKKSCISLFHRLSKRTLQMNYTWNALRRGH